MAGASALDPALHWARRVITRPTTAGGEPFEGVSGTVFQARLDAGAFALHWDAHGLRYGVATTELAPLEQGLDVMVNGSRGALVSVQSAFPDMAVIRISAPSDVLAERLALRGRESRDDIKARLARASYDLPAGIAVIDVQNIGTPAEGIQRLLQAIRA
jgi:phosphonate metabolism protein PhnN/1,5-bisphosphokinase (PRPP-forming)